MNLIFDTSVLVELERGNKEVIEKIRDLRRFYPVPARISFITYFEFLYGLRDKSQKNKEEFIAFVEKFSVIQTSKKTAEILVKLKQNYELPLADLIIAAHTLETGAILVTKDRDFAGIKEIEKFLI